MNTLLVIQNALTKWSGPEVRDQVVMVPTHCLYPSNSVVRVAVTGGQDRFVVDDAGGAFAELYASVPAASDLSKQIANVAKPFGLRMSSKGVIYSPPVSTEDLLATVVLVANASKEAADKFIDKVRPPRRNFRAAIEAVLEKRFHDKWKPNRKMAGASTKLHTFDYLVKLEQNRQLVLDFVLPEPSSINAALVAHMDLSNSNEDVIEQRIVYDDTQPWKSSDLALLKTSSRARVIPLSAIDRNLSKLAA